MFSVITFSARNMAKAERLSCDSVLHKNVFTLLRVEKISQLQLWS